MNSRTVSLRLASLAAAAAMATVTAYGCSSSNSNNPAPSTHDAGGDSTASSSGGSSGGSSGSSSGSVGDSSGGADVVVLDTGTCTSDASTCNSCYTAQQAVADPLNACAPETVNCIPFTGTVPAHPTL
jgi:hypothetical protein